MPVDIARVRAAVRDLSHVAVDGDLDADDTDHVFVTIGMLVELLEDAD